MSTPAVRWVALGFAVVGIAAAWFTVFTIIDDSPTRTIGDTTAWSIGVMVVCFLVLIGALALITWRADGRDDRP